MMIRRPPVSLLPTAQVETIEIGMGVASGLSVLGSLMITGYIVLRLLISCFKHRPPVEEFLHSGGENEKTDFLQAKVALTTHSDRGPVSTPEWLLLWFSELVVLSLSAADLGSALWYLLQLHALGVPCNQALAFFATLFEPASVLCVTFINISLLVLLLRSQMMQTHRQIRNILVGLLCLCCGFTWVPPLILSVVLLFIGEPGFDQVYCWNLAHAERLRLYLYYSPIIVLLLVNLGLMVAIYYTNKKHKLGLTKLAMFWVPASLVLTWIAPSASIIFDFVSDVQPPFWLVMTSSITLPSQGFFNAVLFLVLLGRTRKRVERNYTHFEGTDQEEEFVVDEVKISVFGEKIPWYFS